MSECSHQGPDSTRRPGLAEQLGTLLGTGSHQGRQGLSALGGLEIPAEGRGPWDANTRQGRMNKEPAEPSSVHHHE